MTYTPTQWSSAEDKEKFAAQFRKFVAGDFNRKDFPKWFYNRLNQTFGHIAHYNLDGFYDTFFTCARDKLQFIEQTLDWSCVGDPAFTFSDVERDLQRWVKEQDFLSYYRYQLCDVEGVEARLKLTVPEWNELIQALDNADNDALCTKVSLALHKQGLVAQSEVSRASSG
jgi:hypothetical protein